MKIVSVVGARPQFIKSSVVSKEIATRLRKVCKQGGNTSATVGLAYAFSPLAAHHNHVWLGTSWYELC